MIISYLTKIILQKQFFCQEKTCLCLSRKLLKSYLIWPLHILTICFSIKFFNSLILQFLWFPKKTKLFLYKNLTFELNRWIIWWLATKGLSFFKLIENFNGEIKKFTTISKQSVTLVKKEKKAPSIYFNLGNQN